MSDVRMANLERRVRELAEKLDELSRKYQELSKKNEVTYKFDHTKGFATQYTQTLRYKKPAS